MSTFPAVPGMGREPKGDFAETEGAMPGAFCRVLGEDLKNCRPFLGGALL